MAQRRQVLHWLTGLAAFGGTGMFQAGSRLRLLAVADTGSGDSNQRAVAIQMAAVHRRRPVDLVLLGGDNIYPDGDLARVGANFEAPYRELLSAAVPFHAVLGNHDIRTANGNPQVAYPGFGMAGRWYALRRGPVQLLMLDTNANTRWQDQLPWLRQQLAGSNAAWKVVVGHHQIRSAGFYGDDPQLIQRLEPLFSRYGVQLYIHGHDHHYERSQPIAGTTHLGVGGGGASLRPVRSGRRTARALSRHSFAELDFSAGRLQVSAWDNHGSLIDRASLSSG